MAGPDDAGLNRREITDWENAQVAAIGRRYANVPTEEMTAHLRVHLFELKRGAPRRIRHWKAYCATSLRHEASKIARRWRSWQEREVSPTQIPGPDEQTVDRQEAMFGANLPQEDRRIAFRGVWAKLPPHMQELWLLLEEADGNQTLAARRLRKHRNTIRLWVRRIQDIVRDHGLS